MIEGSVDWILCGLCNVGNTCYLNSGLQMLVGTEHFVSALKVVYPRLVPPAQAYTAAHTSSPSKQMLLQRLSNLVYSMGHCDGNYVNPRDVLQAVVQVNPMFQGYQQQDAQEAFRCILGAMNEECTDPMSPSCIIGRLRDPLAYNGNPLCSSSSRQVQLLEFVEKVYEANRRAEEREQQRRKASSKALVSGFLSSLQPRAGPTIERGPVATVFQGLLLSRIVCAQCTQASHTIEPFLDVSLPIPSYYERCEMRRAADRLAARPRPAAGGLRWWLTLLWQPLAWLGMLMSYLGFGPSLGPVSLGECFQAFCAKEILSGRNRYRCEHCQSLQEATKQMSFLDLPEVLVGHVKRFHFGALWGSKIGDYIQFPVGGDAPLDLAACASEVEGVALPWDTRYTLFAVVVHKGGFGSGHYVAYVLKNEQWFLFDDESIRRASVEEVRNCSAYVLCFHKVPHADPVLHKFKAQAYSYLNQAARTSAADVRYVSRHWLHRLLVTQAPGLILNDMCYCSPGALETATNAAPLSALQDPQAKHDANPQNGSQPKHLQEGVDGSARRHFHYAVDQFYVPVNVHDWEQWVAYFGGGPCIDKDRYDELCRQERQWLKWSVKVGKAD